MAGVKGWKAWRRKQITPELIEELAEHFRKGATLKIAAGLIGVPPGVLRYWLREGEQQDEERYGRDSDEELPPEGRLFAACQKTTAEYLMERISDVTAAEAEWRAASWLLERRDDEFNPAHRVEVSGPDGGPLQVEGRSVVGIADVVALAKELGAGHLIGLDAGAPGGALPASDPVLSDPSEPVEATEPPPELHGS